MKIAVVSLFPDMFEGFTTQGVCGKAVQDKRVDFSTFNPRGYAKGVRKIVDDRPFGGGPGMVLKPETMYQSIKAAKQSLDGAPVIALTPQGQPLTQSLAQALSKLPALVLVAGRYEGIDERVMDKCVDAEISIGDYVLSGGELPAMVLMDAMMRFIPGVLNDPESLTMESFQSQLLDCPHYTRPANWKGLSVPDVLLSGDHGAIERWRQSQRERQTQRKRPDLWQRYCCSQATTVPNEE